GRALAVGVPWYPAARYAGFASVELIQRARFPQGCEVGIRGRGVAEGLIERDGAHDAFPRGVQVATLASVATEIELDRGVLRMSLFGLPEDGLGLAQRFASPRRVGESDPPAGFVRLLANEFAGNQRQLRPPLLLLQHGRAQSEGARAILFLEGKLGRPGGRVIDEAELEESAGMRKAPARVHESNVRTAGLASIGG